MMYSRSALARWSSRLLVAASIAFAHASAASAGDGVELLHPDGSAQGNASDLQLVAMPDQDLEQVRGRQLVVEPARSSERERKRVVLWDEARSALPPGLRGVSTGNQVSITRDTNAATLPSGGINLNN